MTKHHYPLFAFVVLGKCTFVIVLLYHRSPTLLEIILCISFSNGTNKIYKRVHFTRTFWPSLSVLTLILSPTVNMSRKKDSDEILDSIKMIILSSYSGLLLKSLSWVLADDSSATIAKAGIAVTIGESNDFVSFS